MAEFVTTINRQAILDVLHAELAKVRAGRKWFTETAETKAELGEREQQWLAHIAEVRKLPEEGIEVEMRVVEPITQMAWASLPPEIQAQYS